jgi:hypothetical protein
VENGVIEFDLAGIFALLTFYAANFPVNTVEVFTKLVERKEVLFAEVLRPAAASLEGCESFITATALGIVTQLDLHGCDDDFFESFRGAQQLGDESGQHGVGASSADLERIAAPGTPSPAGVPPVGGAVLARLVKPQGRAALGAHEVPGVGRGCIGSARSRTWARLSLSQYLLGALEFFGRDQRRIEDVADNYVLGRALDSFVTVVAMPHLVTSSVERMPQYRGHPGCWDSGLPGDLGITCLTT